MIENRRKAISQELNANAYEIERAVMEYNQRSQTADHIFYSPDYRHEHGVDFFKAVCALEREVERVFNRLKIIFWLKSKINCISCAPASIMPL